MKKSLLKKFLLSGVLILLAQSAFFPCTSAVISGKATADGRPLLWKHRDSDSQENKLMYFSGEKFNFIGVINSSDSTGKEIWMGTNSSGFSIMNTMSYNLNIGQKCDVPNDQEGLFMKAALERCANLEDFEKFLDEGKGKWGVAANFGCIDAKGGAAYYEAGYYSYMKFDVNDPRVAPNGYLIRTNFSFTGDGEHGMGYIRFATAIKLFNEYYKDSNITLDFVLKQADRNLQNSLTKSDLNTYPMPEDTSVTFIPFRDYIVRNSTVSSMIVQGVRPSEDPSLTTMWTVLGFPLTTIVTPVWVAAGETLPSVTCAEAGKTAPINKKSLTLKKKCFPALIDNGRDYLNIAAFKNKKGTGLAQKLLPKESEIVEKTAELISQWRKNGFKKEDALKQYKWLDQYVNKVYKEEFGI